MTSRIVSLSLILTILAIIWFFSVAPAFGANALLDGNRTPRVFGSDCTASSSQEMVGNQYATLVSATSTSRSFLRLQLFQNATNTYYVSLNDILTTTGSGGSGIIATNTPMDMGLSTTFPYEGAVRLKTDNGSTTVLVTECTY